MAVDNALALFAPYNKYRRQWAPCLSLPIKHPISFRTFESEALRHCRNK